MNLITPILATPFGVTALAEAPRFNPALLELFAHEATEANREPTLRRDPFCFRSRENLFESNHPAVAQVRGEMLAGLCAIVLQANQMSEAEFSRLGVQVRARFAILKPNGAIPCQTLPLASWALIYCLSAPEPTPARVDSASLRLYGARVGSMFMDAGNCSLRPPFAGGHYVWTPVPGQMAVFPSTIAHEIALNRGDKDLVLVIGRARFATTDQEFHPSW